MNSKSFKDLTKEAEKEVDKEAAAMMDEIQSKFDIKINHLTKD